MNSNRKRVVCIRRHGESWTVSIARQTRPDQWRTRRYHQVSTARLETLHRLGRRHESWCWQYRPDRMIYLIYPYTAVYEQGIWGPGWRLPCETHLQAWGAVRRWARQLHNTKTRVIKTGPDTYRVELRADGGWYGSLYVV